MDAASKRVRDHAQHLIGIADELLTRATHEPGIRGSTWMSLPRSEAQTLDTRSRAFLAQPQVPPTYLAQYERRCHHPYQGEDLAGGVDSLRAIVADIDNGAFPSFAATAHADTLADVLDQVDACIDESKFLQAVMLAGGVLEAHLRFVGESRKLALPHGSLGKWNELLFKEGVYEKAIHSQVAAWTNQRNRADHLNDKEFSSVVARSMAVGVRELLAHLPA